MQLQEFIDIAKDWSLFEGAGTRLLEGLFHVFGLLLAVTLLKAGLQKNKNY